MWPWSYDRCGEISELELKQEINACSDQQMKFNMKPFVGRGSPEIGNQLPADYYIRMILICIRYSGSNGCPPNAWNQPFPSSLYE
jgi:hypothetical protein